MNFQEKGQRVRTAPKKANIDTELNRNERTEIPGYPGKDMGDRD